MDGVGKSTVCKLLAEKLGYIFIEKNLRELFDEDGKFDNYIRIRDKVNKSDDKLFTAWFYGLSNVYLRTVHKDHNIVTDRYLLSNYAWSGADDNKAVYYALVRNLGHPDLTVILYASDDVITQRLRGRNENDKDLNKVSLSKQKYEKMVLFCTTYKIPYMVIDTSELTPEQTVERILKRIEGRP